MRRRKREERPKVVVALGSAEDARGAPAKVRVVPLGDALMELGRQAANLGDLRKGPAMAAHPGVLLAWHGAPVPEAQAAKPELAEEALGASGGPTLVQQATMHG